MHHSGTAAAPHAPQLGGSLRTVLAHDADQLACELTNWNQRYDQISAGLFAGALTELRQPGLQVFREDLSQAVRQSCRVWPDAIWFGLPDHEGELTRINGRQSAADWIMVQAGNVEFELVTPAAYRIYGIVASRQLLAETARRLGCAIDWTRVQAAELLQVDAAARAACVRTLRRLLPASDGGGPLGSASALTAHAAAGAAHWQDAVLVGLLEMLDRSCVEPAMAASLQRRRQVVALARDYMLAHRGDSITVPELCERVHVSRRTLQYCFEDVLGMSPNAYLRMLRLNGVRRQLHDGRAIGELAGEWGLCNFSQFSSDYRKLFGLSPSAAQKLRI
ncbi:helix-turn-helix domain-containing protein [Duganella sp. FT80W]|uniref:Helix-turn-helix domain-containing protein n=1 Tax=Duganella guangzhouensis TaxID=2666084 RepID=A0A6I2LCZ2_9BURK|nr:helix-turn-helix domain-containing protein [Duganella guangzhouensis]MRW94694.1 helix-turn-helix domain-containing protein [Duganella guangzhouensis]